MKSKKWIIVVAAVALSGVSSCETMKKGWAHVDAALKQANANAQAHEQEQARQALAAQGTEPNARTMAAIGRIAAITRQHLVIIAELYSYPSAQMGAQKMWALIPQLQAACKEFAASIRANPTSAQRSAKLLLARMESCADQRLQNAANANSHFYNSPAMRQAHSDYLNATKVAGYQ